MKPNRVVTLYRECGGASFHGKGGDLYMYVCGKPLRMLWKFPTHAGKIDMVLSQRKHAKAYMVEATGKATTRVTVTLSSGRRRHFYLTVDAFYTLKKFGMPCWVRLEYDDGR